MTPPPLRGVLDEFKSDHLGLMIHNAGVSEVPKTKEAKVALWALLLPDAKRIRRSLEALTPRCRSALEVLQGAGGELRTARFAARLNRAGLLEQQSRQPRPKSSWQNPQPEDAVDPVTFPEVVAALMLQGLICTYQNVSGSAAKLALDNPGRFVYIPAEVAVHLPPPPARSETPVKIDHTQSASARTCQRELYLVWSTARDAPLTLTAAGLLRMSDLKRLDKQLLTQEAITTGTKEGDYRHILFLRRLATALGLLRWSDAGGAATLAAAADPAFLHAEPAERVKLSYEAWRRGVWWNELWATYVPNRTSPNGSPGDEAPGKVITARERVLAQIIHRAKAGAEWIALDSISRWLLEHDEEFLVERQSADQQGYSIYSQGRYFLRGASPYVVNQLLWQWEAGSNSEEAGWNEVEAVFIHAVAAEGLYWLGLADLGYVQPGAAKGGAGPAQVTAIRLTEMGRWLLLNETRPAIPEETGRVVLQPNFHVVAFDPIADRVLARLDTFANRLNAERAIEYEITRDSIYRGMQSGQSADEIKAWLAGVTGSPMPQNVERSLDEWQTAYNRIAVRPRVAVVQATKPELIDTLMAQPQMHPAIIRRIDATLLMVDAAQLDAVEAMLLAMDELPARSRPSGQESPDGAAISVDADGAITFAQGPPSLTIQGALGAFADRSRDGAWRITPASVRRARASGMEVPAILAELNRLAGGMAPADLAAQLKVWGGHFGEATVQSLVLVEFRDQATLDELLADRDLKRYIKPFKPRAKLGLATIRAEDQAAVQALLADRGVTVRNL